MSDPMEPPRKDTMALNGKMTAIELLLAGPRQEARVSSHIPHITIFVLTDTAQPKLDPVEAIRVVSKGLLGCPPQVLREYCPPSKSLVSKFLPPGSPPPPLYSA